MTLTRLAIMLTAICVALAAAPAATRARCAIQRLGIEPLTPLSQPLPVGAGIVLALRPGSHDTDAQLGAVTIGTVGMGGGGLVMTTPLAPGLAVASLAGMPPGRHTLRGIGPTEIPFTIDARALPAPPAAPRVASITVTERGRAGTSVSGDVSAPGAVALTLEVGGTHIGYGLVPPRGPADLHPFGRCASPPSSYRIARRGESIVVRAVDAYGRLSPPAPAVVAR